MSEYKQTVTRENLHLMEDFMACGNTPFKRDAILLLYQDNGTDCPAFKEKTSRGFSEAWYCSLSELKGRLKVGALPRQARWIIWGPSFGSGGSYNTMEEAEEAAMAMKRARPEKNFYVAKLGSVVEMEARIVSLR